MNKLCFKKIFNKRSGTIIAVSEAAKSQGKTLGTARIIISNSNKFNRLHSTPAVVSPLSALALSLLLTQPLSVSAQSLPTGGQVVGGNANIGQNGNTMTINQSTNRAAINWNTFNIGQGYTVQFNQPGTKSITLNRV
ncbi:MAG: hypothetical protein LBE24_00070, partial [Methylobacillus sp.]|nr:hypothetical protein [Methylobacillus sp.]